MVTARSQTCCSSPSSMVYWFSVSLVAWGMLSLIGIYWYPLHASSASTILIAMAIGCAVNWFRNRVPHCAITGPAFLIAGAVFSPLGMEKLAVRPRFVWSGVLVVTAMAFFFEWLYAARNKRP